ncbi:MAG: DUF2812 domain-containing protein [Eubacteriales bacterium]
MKKIVYKPYWNYEKEQMWLNQMANEGWALCDYSWIKYTFEPCEKGEYVYYIDLLGQHHSHPKSTAFIEMVEETDVEHVASYMRWVYFRKKADGKPFELYTDLDSKIRQLKRINRFWTVFIAVEFAIGFSNLSIWGQSYATGEASNLNLYGGLFLILVGVLLMTVAYPVRLKIRALMREKKIRE